MARIAKFERGAMQKMQLHDEINATIFTQEVDGRRMLQISTYGRADREIPGKLSQTIQLDERAAKELFVVLREHFRFE